MDGKIVMPAQATAEQVKVANNGQIVVSAKYDREPPDSADPGGFQADSPMFLRYSAGGQPDLSFGNKA